MKRIYNIILTLLLPVLFTGASCSTVYAQERYHETEDTPISDSLRIAVDSIIRSRPSLINDELDGKNIFTLLRTENGNGQTARINQSDSLFKAMNHHIRTNRSRTTQGFRLRIFLDNRRSARADSERAEKEFIVRYPQYPTYRSYSNPYFKVTVGDFRTRSEALNALNRIKGDYPAAFIVKESILPLR